MTRHDEPDDDRALDRALAGLSPDMAPPDALRVATAARLAQAGLLRRVRPARRFQRVLAVAALVAFAFVVGRISALPSPDTGAIPTGEPSWALLLYDTVDAASAADVDLVSLYGAWATETRAAGRLTLAEKLGDEGALLRDGEAHAVADEGGLGIPSGVFIVQASDLETALALARGVPHHRLGGAVLVRRVEPT